MRVLVPVSDMHCGAPGGLTTREHQWSVRAKGLKGEWGRIQREARKEYRGLIGWVKKSLGEPDIVVAAGDLVDGLNSKERGVGQVVIDPEEQAQMAAELLSWWGAKAYVFVAGSPYHTGQDVDYEERVISHLQALFYEKDESPEIYPMKTRRFMSVEGRTIQVKHFARQTTIPYGFGTPLAKEWMANLLWWLQDTEDPIVPRCDFFIQAHIHAFGYIEGWADGRAWGSLSLPALCVGRPHDARGKYERKLGYRPVHWGLAPVVVDGDNVTVHKKIALVREAEAEVLRFA